VRRYVVQRSSCRLPLIPYAFAQGGNRKYQPPLVDAGAAKDRSRAPSRSQYACRVGPGSHDHCHCEHVFAREGLTAFCCHHGRAWPHSWYTADAPRAPAPSMPVRKYYSARRRHFPLDAPEQCCGVCLSTLTNRGSTPCTPLSFLWMPLHRRPGFQPPMFSIGQNGPR